MRIRVATPPFVFALAACGPGDGPADDPTHDSGADAPLELVEGTPLPCDAPVDVTYVDAAAAMGLHGMTVDLTSGQSDGGGVVADDFDGDGDLDLAFTYQGEDHLWIFLRDGDTFTASALPVTAPYLPSLADIDGDGVRDIVVGGSRPSYFFNRGGTFEAHDLAIDMGRGEARELEATDLDGDGDDDLFAAASSRSEDTLDDAQDFVLWNDGGQFTRELLPEPQASGKSYDATIFDADGDGDPDVYVSNDAFDDWPANSFYRNDDGTLVDDGADCFCDLRLPAMGATSGDYDGDGILDVYIAAEGQNHLLRGMADATFVDVTQATHADPTSDNFQMSWGAQFVDTDNDGVREIVLASGDFAGWEAKGTGEVPVYLLRPQSGTFVDVSEDVGLARGTYRAVLPEDFNGDGVLDLLVTQLADTPRLYLSQGCTANAWIAVEAPVGSRVVVEAGGTTQMAVATTDSGYGANKPPVAWFGLGDAAVVDRLTVTRPWGGATGEWTGLATRQRVWVR